MDYLSTFQGDSCLSVARQASNEGIRAHFVAAGLTEIEPLLGPQVPFGQSQLPELYRLKGELLLERDDPAAAGEALTCFQESLRLGWEMGTLAWQLRAAMSLVRLRERQGEANEAGLAEPGKLEG